MKAYIFNIQRFSLHDGAGIRTVVFFGGCNLRCKWCANPESFFAQSGQIGGMEAGRHYTLDEVFDVILKDKPFYEKSGGGATLSGGEPLLQHDFVCALCDKLHEAGINVGMETAAGVPSEIFERAIKKCDFALIDLKHWNPYSHMEGTGIDNSVILANIGLALSLNIPVTVRIPVIPEFNNLKTDFHSFSRVLNELGVRDVHLLPFHQLGENKYKELGIPYTYSGVPQLHDEDLKAFADVLIASGLRVQIGG